MPDDAPLINLQPCADTTSSNDLPSFQIPYEIPTKGLTLSRSGTTPDRQAGPRTAVALTVFSPMWIPANGPGPDERRTDTNAAPIPQARTTAIQVRIGRLR